MATLKDILNRRKSINSYKNLLEKEKYFVEVEKSIAPNFKKCHLKLLEFIKKFDEYLKSHKSPPLGTSTILFTLAIFSIITGVTALKPLPSSYGEAIFDLVWSIIHIGMGIFGMMALAEYLASQLEGFVEDSIITF